MVRKIKMGRPKRIAIKLTKSEVIRIIQLVDDYDEGIGFHDRKNWNIYNSIREKFEKKLGFF